MITSAPFSGRQPLSTWLGVFQGVSFAEESLDPLNLVIVKLNGVRTITIAPDLP